MRRARISLIALALAALIAALVPASASAERQARSLEERLARALAPAAADGTITGALVIDVTTREVVYAARPRRSFVPASTEKLPIALAALHRLGADFRTTTTLYGLGRQAGTTWRGDLVLKGTGDPDLRTRDLKQLARAVEQLGIERVTGSVIGDESYFDSIRTAPGWKPSFYKRWSPPISALVVDRARLETTIVDEPALAAAAIMTRLLERRGVTVRGIPAVGSPSLDEAVALARDRSRTVESLVDTMNTESDNFIAEMLLKTLGAELRERGTTQAGSRVVRSTLRQLDVPLPGIRIKDGSGLSRSDRLTPRALTAMLLSALDDPEIGDEFIGSLAVGGRTGTLEDRLKSSLTSGRVRAKTGTTSVSSALAGFVDSRYAFAVLMNRSSVNSFRARAAQDRFVTVLARAA